MVGLGPRAQNLTENTNVGKNKNYDFIYTLGVPTGCVSSSKSPLRALMPCRPVLCRHGLQVGVSVLGCMDKGVPMECVGVGVRVSGVRVCSFTFAKGHRVTA